MVAVDDFGTPLVVEYLLDFVDDLYPLVLPSLPELPLDPSAVPSVVVSTIVVSVPPPAPEAEEVPDVPEAAVEVIPVAPVVVVVSVVDPAPEDPATEDPILLLLPSTSYFVTVVMTLFMTVVFLFFFRFLLFPSVTLALAAELLEESMFKDAPELKLIDWKDFGADVRRSVSSETFVTFRPEVPSSLFLGPSSDIMPRGVSD